MLRFLSNHSSYSFATKVFNVNDYSAKDYFTICKLLKQKYLVHNEGITSSHEIKLINSKGNFLGIYPASQARRKADSLKQDLILVNPNCVPIMCKVEDFRNSTLNKFFDEIINKHNDKLIQKAEKIKTLKVGANLTEMELKLKAKQLINLSKKNYKVKAYMNCKNVNKDQSLQKMELVKSFIESDCFVEIEVREETVKEHKKDWKQNEKDKQAQKITLAMTFVSKGGEFTSMLNQSFQANPDLAVQKFLRKFYKQEDSEMRDLGNVEQNYMPSIKLDFLSKKSRPITQQLSTRSDNEEEDNKRDSTEETMLTSHIEKNVGLEEFTLDKTEKMIEREAKARILKDRLSRLISTQAN